MKKDTKKKTIKNIIVFALSTIMAVSLFTGCGVNNKKTTTNKTGTSQSQSQSSNKKKSNKNQSGTNKNQSGIKKNETPNSKSNKTKTNEVDNKNKENGTEKKDKSSETQQTQPNTSTMLAEIRHLHRMQSQQTNKSFFIASFLEMLTQRLIWMSIFYHVINLDYFQKGDYFKDCVNLQTGI